MLSREKLSREKFCLGIDYGTESGRVVAIRVRDGREMGAAIVPYTDGVIDKKLPDGPNLEADWALQNPRDYLEVVARGIPRALKEAGVKPENVIGLGTDFTASTPLPAKRDGTPLSLLKEYRRHPHAWVKLWKHHAAQPEANRINAVGRERDEEFIRVSGGKYSSEWFFAKLLQILEEAPEIYAATDRFLEAADWIVWQLTGVEKRNSCTAGYKAMWIKGRRFPSRAFFRALDPRMANVIAEKIGETYYPAGDCAGGLTEAWARKTGLKAGTPVSIGNVDAHGAVPAATVTGAGSMVMIMGTSICHMLLRQNRQVVEGMCGVVEDGIVPGLWGYEAGQSAAGDIFAWFTKTFSAIHADLEKKAAALRPGESGLLALDWWNGNRSVLVDVDLTGVIAGMTLATTAPEIYRVLIESTAFGTRQIIEAFERKGVPVRNLVACGGLPERNRLLMQIYADVTGREISIAARPLTCPALGAAMHGAVAARKAGGGYDTIFEAARHMAHLNRRTYRPNPAHHRMYDQLFGEYRTLHDYFGRGANDVMKRLKALPRPGGS